MKLSLSNSTARSVAALAGIACLGMAQPAKAQSLPPGWPNGLPAASVTGPIDVEIDGAPASGSTNGFVQMNTNYNTPNTPTNPFHQIVQAGPATLTTANCTSVVNQYLAYGQGANTWLATHGYQYMDGFATVAQLCPSGGGGSGGSGLPSCIAWRQLGFSSQSACCQSFEAHGQKPPGC